MIVFRIYPPRESIWMSKLPEEKVFLGKRLRALREQNGLTQEAFAEKIRFSYKVYQSIEAGRRWNLRMATILRFAAAYGITLSQMFALRTPKTDIKGS